MNDPLTEAILAAGRELVDEYGWDIDEKDTGYPAPSGEFVSVLEVHLRPLLMPAWRESRIAQLRAEIEQLEAQS